MSNDLISRQAAIDAFTGVVILEPAQSAKKYIDGVIERIQNLPSAQPEQRWIPCSERLPEVSYDHLGNWNSPEVILLMNDEEYMRVCNGHFNPIGVFEVLEDDGPAFIGKPVEHIAAWMPLPEPWRGEKDETD